MKKETRSRKVVERMCPDFNLQGMSYTYWLGYVDRSISMLRRDISMRQMLMIDENWDRWYSVGRKPVLHNGKKNRK